MKKGHPVLQKKIKLREVGGGLGQGEKGRYNVFCKKRKRLIAIFSIPSSLASKNKQ